MDVLDSGKENEAKFQVMICIGTSRGANAGNLLV
jgi:hypothetical protein